MQTSSVPVDADRGDDERLVDVPPERWDAMFAPSSLVAVITTIDGDGCINAAAFGTCTRISHAPVELSFAVSPAKDTRANVLTTGEFVVNTPRFEPRQLEQVRITGLDFEPGENELVHAGLTPVRSRVVAPPRIAEFPRHFECRVEWTKEWRGRLFVCGRVVAVSCHASVVDEEGSLRWEQARPFHYCGWPYGDAFVPAYEVHHAPMTYTGPEADAGERGGAVVAPAREAASPSRDSTPPARAAASPAAASAPSPAPASDLSQELPSA